MLSVLPGAILIIAALSSRAEAATAADCVQQGGSLPCVDMTIGPWVYYLNGYQFRGSDEQTVIDEYINWYSQQSNEYGYALVCPGSFTYSSTPWSSTSHVGCKGTEPLYINGVEAQNTEPLLYSFSQSSYNGSCPGGTVTTSACMVKERTVECPDGYTMTGYRPGHGYTSYEPSVQYCAPTNFVRYTIRLSGGNTTEPWNKKRDPDHTAANLSYEAIVMDQSGQPKANIGVSITSDVTLDSGGHIHENGRPKGKLAPATLSTKDGIATITGVTDSNGIFSFTFGAEEASGEHQLTATCTGCAAPATATVNVLIPGLTLLGVDPANYDLQGYRDWHPGNHYFSEAAIVQIINLAHAYRLAPVFDHQLLIINDSSLVKGGVFDLGQDWTYKPNGHQGHRKGIVVDINNYHALSPLFVRLAKKCCNIDAIWEGPDVTDTPHYHLWLLGRDE